jgi:hypothetical protein
MKPSVIGQQVEFAPELVMDGDDGPVDIADQAVAKNDVRDLPIATRTYIWQRVQARNDRGRASRLVAERLVGEFRQFRNGFAYGRHRILQSVAMIPPYLPAHRITIDCFDARRRQPHVRPTETIKQVTS